jgi:hypothetical protein
MHHLTYSLKAAYALRFMEGKCTTSLMSQEAVAGVAYKSTPEAYQGI